MKNLLLPILLVLFLASCGEQKPEGPAMVKGKWSRKVKAEKLNLYKVENGNLHEVASSAIGADSTFTFAFEPEKGNFYYIGVNPMPKNRYAFYLKPGDNLNFTINDSTYVLNGKNSSENVEITKWHDFIQPLELMSFYSFRDTYVTFFPLLEEKIKGNFPASKTKNKAFNSEFEDYKKFNMLQIAMNFLFTPRTAHPQGEDFPDYYRNINIADYTTTTAALDYPEGIDLINRAIFYKIRLDNSIPKERKAELAANPANAIMKSIEMIVNDTIKGEMTMRFAGNNKTLPGLLDYDSKYSKYLITEAQKTRMQNLKNKLNVPEKGAPAIDFKFPDINGKMVSLSDFKGKIVYIDVWATWCGPCKGEIPHLKKLETEYHNNKDIVFMSVGTDKSSDKQKWVDYVNNEKLEGVQLFAGDGAKQGLLEPYRIKGIPRFILVGKDGNLISEDAPRPSSTEIRPLLNVSLK